MVPRQPPYEKVANRQRRALERNSVTWLWCSAPLSWSPRPRRTGTGDQRLLRPPSCPAATGPSPMRCRARSRPQERSPVQTYQPEVCPCGVCRRPCTGHSHWPSIKDRATPTSKSPALIATPSSWQRGCRVLPAYRAVHGRPLMPQIDFPPPAAGRDWNRRRRPRRGWRRAGWHYRTVSEHAPGRR